MSLSVKVYDWPSIIPARQLFFAGGQEVEGGFTSGGARTSYPEPGGRSYLDVDFAYQKYGATDTLISWVMSKIANGTIFRVPIVKTPQVLSAVDVGLTEQSDGVPWAAEGLIPEHSWDNGQNWEYEFGAVAAAAALEGSTALSIDMGSLPAALKVGHVFGIGDVAYKVDDIEWNGTVAEMEIVPPLRADVSADAFITFRPKMLCVATNPESFRAMYEPADLIKPGSLRFMEAIL